VDEFWCNFVFFEFQCPFLGGAWGYNSRNRFPFGNTETAVLAPSKHGVGYPDSVSLVKPPTTTIVKTNPAEPSNQYPTARGGTISAGAEGMAWLEKNFASMRRGVCEDQVTCHRRDGNRGFGLGRGRLKWKNEVGRETGRKARRRGRIMTGRGSSLRDNITY
jgi:hypothetical protein